MISDIVKAIADYENEHGRRPDYVMIHPARMAHLWREFGEIKERGLIRKDGRTRVEILGVELRESAFLPLRDSENKSIECFLALDTAEAIYRKYPPR